MAASDLAGGVARLRWRPLIRRGDVAAAVDASGRVGQCPAGARGFLGFRGEGEIRKTGGLFIGIGGARRVQMRCGFRPRDRDRTLYMMEKA